MLYIYIYIYIYVEEGFDDEQGTSTKLVPVKKTAEQMDAQKKEDHKSRQISFLNSEEVEVKPSEWRPKKVHRAYARSWCRNVDSQFQISTSLNGLEFFVRKPDDSNWTDCFDEPHVAVAMDVGSDGNAGYHGLERLFNFNTEQRGDQNHASNCDWAGMSGAMNMTGTQLLNIVT